MWHRNHSDSATIARRLRELPNVDTAEAGSGDEVYVNVRHSHQRDVTRLLYEEGYVILDISGEIGPDRDHYIYAVHETSEWL